MGELANGNLKQTAAGVRPLDAVVDGLATDVSVTYFLLPIPESDQSQRSNPNRKWTTREPILNLLHGTVSLSQQRRARALAKRITNEICFHCSSEACRRTKGDEEICFAYNLGKCTRLPPAMCVWCPGVRGRTPNMSASDSGPQTQPLRRKRSFEQMAGSTSLHDTCTTSSMASPSDFYAVELFCGTGGLTYSMRHFFKDSIGVDLKSGPSKARTITLDLRTLANQELVTSWCTASHCFGYISEHLVAQQARQDPGA